MAVPNLGGRAGDLVMRTTPPPQKKETKYHGVTSVGAIAYLTVAIAVIITKAKHWLPVS